jgi:O-antigen/teichoic acid export membrane protein
MSLRKRYLFGMISGAGSVVVKTGLNIVLIPVMIAHLGLDTFGFYILLISILEISMLLDFGATGALVKLLGGEQTDSLSRRNYLKVGHSLFSLLAGLFLILGLLLAPGFPGMFRIPPALMPVAQIAFLLTVLEATLTIYSCYYRSVLLAHCAHQWTNVADTLYAIVANLGSLLLVLAGMDLPAVLGIRLISALLRLLLMMAQSLQLEKFAFFPRVPLRQQTCAEVLRLSFHAMMINFSIIVSHKIDDLVIARFLPIGAVGVYEIVFRFLGIVIQICLKLSEGSFPLFARMATDDRRDDARQLFLRMSGLLNFVAAMLLMLILSYYPELFQIFSAGRIPIEQTLPVLMLAVPVILSGVLQMPAGNWLFTWGHQKMLTVSSVATAIANLLLSILLVQSMGIAGVALGTLIPQLIQHQAVLIHKTCQWLQISLKQYLGSVHGGILIPVGLAFLWIQLWKSLTTGLSMPLFSMALVAASALMLGGGLWFWLTATTIEREVFMENLLQTVKFKLKSKPTTGNATHGQNAG